MLQFAALAAFALFFAGAWLGGPAFSFGPPYWFRPGDLWGEFNSFAFVAFASLLFFGAGGVVALAVEGLKWGSLFSSAVLVPVNYLFIVPELLACMAMVWLGKAVLDDLENHASLSSAVRRPALLFAASAVVFALLVGAKVFLGKGVV